MTKEDKKTQEPKKSLTEESKTPQETKEAEELKKTDDEKTKEPQKPEEPGESVKSMTEEPQKTTEPGKPVNQKTQHFIPKPGDDLPDHFIPIPECERLLSMPLRFMACVDGSATAATGVEYTLQCLMQQDKRHSCELVHISDRATEDDLPPKWRPKAVQADCEAKLAVNVSKARGSFVLLNRKPNEAFGDLLLAEANRFNADFIVMGFLGQKASEGRRISGADLGRPGTSGGLGRPCSAAGISREKKAQEDESIFTNMGDTALVKRKTGNSPQPKRNAIQFRRMYTIHPISSNNMILLGHAKASIIVMQKDFSETLNVLPVFRPARFVVSTSLNAAATQAFLDALRLSKPGDFIDVVYVKSFMELTESDYTRALRQKYTSFFDGLQGSTNSEQFCRFKDRTCTFRFLEKRRGKTTAQVVADYANDMNADFVCVGTNLMRAEKGKEVLGSVSAEVILECTTNIVVSHYNPYGDSLQQD
eukprot:gnl/MRDRNA2_/MRDRNA2_33751_c0_seq2.p1 gnl/MRDRNA2_/MRDRNA2_33751_c0~~gnl/MRDRNA2_/MRDRNA2_33751_c0_seq2.p1  ORF type:complete len:484 (+),score=76.72 gnl/MRDRNA2_/MRDRNA2_33751_c0_seq2:23-1453(+)